MSKPKVGDRVRVISYENVEDKDELIGQEGVVQEVLGFVGVRLDNRALHEKFIPEHSAYAEPLLFRVHELEVIRGEEVVDEQLQGRAEDSNH